MAERKRDRRDRIRKRWASVLKVIAIIVFIAVLCLVFMSK